jgi:hypothetical protein
VRVHAKLFQTLDEMVFDSPVVVQHYYTGLGNTFSHIPDSIGEFDELSHEFFSTHKMYNIAKSFGLLDNIGHGLAPTALEIGNYASSCAVKPTGNSSD